MRKTSLPFPPKGPSAVTEAPGPLLPYASSLEHLLDELTRIDTLVRWLVLRARHADGAGGAGGDRSLRGLAISEGDVDALLQRPLGQPSSSAAFLLPEAHAALDAMLERIALRRALSAREGVTLRLDALASAFALSRFDVDVLLLGLAPELDPRYDQLFAYLHDDVTRKRPGVAVAMDLLCPSLEIRLAARARFSPGAPLLRHELIHLFTDPPRLHPPLVSCSFKVDERIVDYLHDTDALDARLSPFACKVTPTVGLADLLLPAAQKERLGGLFGAGADGDAGQVVYLQGPYGVGKQATAEALCHALGRELLVVRGALLARAPDETLEMVVRLAAREARLSGAALYWEGFDLLLSDEKLSAQRALLGALLGLSGPCFLSGEAPFEPTDALRGNRFVRVEIGLPSRADRATLWARALDGEEALAPDVDLPLFADRYRLSAGQIHDAAGTARGRAHLRDPAHGQVTMADLAEAAPLHGNRQLGAVARKIDAVRAWDDLVLPKDRKDRLREICNHARYRGQVLEDWGFEGKLPNGKGLSLLFTGPPGTGKTMAAGVLAGELGLHLYQIDLSSVVSKYIGETEKQLSRIFAEAERSQAILFFDEADALFGKRSEVRDAHDRYANIETSYLLQRMETYEGVTILASNHSQNMDEAFVRRIQFIIDFGLPAERERLAIWERIWPPGVPRAPELDLPYMARRFELAGGHIRNIALAAAYLAAADGSRVGQKHLLHATRREYQKMGKVADEGMFVYRP